MIVKLTHDRGAVVMGDIPVSEIETPAELAASLLLLLPDVMRVRVWRDGGSVSDKPDADTTRAQRQADDAAVGEFLRSAYADILSDLVAIMDLDVGLSLVLNGTPGWDAAERFLSDSEPEPGPDDLAGDLRWRSFFGPHAEPNPKPEDIATYWFWGSAADSSPDSRQRRSNLRLDRGPDITPPV